MRLDSNFWIEGTPGNVVQLKPESDQTQQVKLPLEDGNYIYWECDGMKDRQRSKVAESPNGFCKFRVQGGRGRRRERERERERERVLYI